jgi:MFS family permease
MFSTAFSAAYRRYALGTLTLVYMLSCLDQSLMGLVLQPIKEDLHLSDSQLGFLTGIAFALFYSTLGVPIARWADRGNRVTIASVAIALWGVAVMSSLFVTNFAQLVAARVAAGIGGSGCMPPTYSLLGDYYPAPAQRTRVMAVYMMSGPIGSVVSYVTGGWLNVHYGWRIALFAMGVPGLIVALLLKATLKEPRQPARGQDVLHSRDGLYARNVSHADDLSHARDASHGHDVSAHDIPAPPMPRVTQVLSDLWFQPASRHLAIALIALITLTGGMFSWLGTFLIRSHGMTTADLGVWFGVIFGASGTLGVAMGGYIAQRWFGEDERGQMRLFAILTAALLPCYAVLLLSARTPVALTALSLCVLIGNFAIGPAFALVQRLVIHETRATTMALIMLLANLMGMGMGPQVVGILSDGMSRAVGNDSLRYAMLATALLAPWSAYHLWRVGRVVEEGLRLVALRDGSHVDADSDANANARADANVDVLVEVAKGDGRGGPAGIAPKLSASK